MFRSAQTFNQPVSHFDVRRVTEMGTIDVRSRDFSFAILSYRIHVRYSVCVPRMLRLQPELGGLEYKQCDEHE